MLIEDHTITRPSGFECCIDLQSDVSCPISVSVIAWGRITLAFDTYLL